LIQDGCPNGLFQALDLETMNYEMSEEALKFVAAIKAKVDLRDKSTWYKGAYSTFQRPLGIAGITLTDGEKASLFSNLRDRIAKITPNYDAWIHSSIVDLSVLAKIPIGCTQKLMNIITKYYYVAEILGLASLDRTETLLLQNKNWFHIPIDNVILYSLKTKYRKHFGDDIKITLHPRRNSKGKLQSPQTYIRIKNTWTPWSAIDDIQWYDDFQQRVKILTRSLEYIRPIDFEMKELWIT
jgi:hypothetical protein